MEPHTWQLRLAWDGAVFAGWQWQPNARTVQQVVEEALSRLMGGEPVRATASGRTDSGVHVLEQVVSFRSQTWREPAVIVRALNGMLPPEIACLSAAPAPAGFNARRWCRRKLYRYRVLHREARCPHRWRHTWRERPTLDVAGMRLALRDLVGQHDFTSFRASGCTAKHPVRRIEDARLVEADGDLYADELHFEFLGHGFLRYQVRNMVGTLLEIGRGHRPAGSLPALLAARDRKLAGPTAAAQGLWLVAVEMGAGPGGAEE